jgi:hypothetical protein
MQIHTDFYSQWFNYKFNKTKTFIYMNKESYESYKRWCKSIFSNL